ncbi:MAG: GDP-fucose synthetase [Candidatus Cloacimonadota bacterium]|nr:MAG: GDP-fucose synthetase [Candidatus Cloacimonadota bacterium]
MNKDSKIYIAGHNGMVGSAILKLLQKQNYTNVIVKNKKELNLLNREEVSTFFQDHSPEYVFLAAAKVGGIKANTDYPADFLYENVMIQMNVIHEAYQSNVKKTLILGSSCIYPKDSIQPMREDYLLAGKLEPTNEGYALSKIVALKMGEYYNKQYGMNIISLMPPNLYGVNDSFDLNKSHVLSALVKRFVDIVDDGRDEITLWGSGIAKREFMYVDDIATASVFFMKSYDEPHFINIGWGKDISIKDLAILISEEVGFSGKIYWDTTKSDGMLKKCLDITKMKKTDYFPEVGLKEGIRRMVKYYRNEKKVGNL